jgi:hypothetical protein
VVAAPVLTAAALVVLLGWVALAGSVVGWVIDAIERRRLGRVAAQIHVTDAVHGVLGPVVSPTVAKHRGQPWTVTMGLAPRDFAIAGSLAEIAREALGREAKDVRIVFVPRPGS